MGIVIQTEFVMAIFTKKLVKLWKRNFVKHDLAIESLCTYYRCSMSFQKQDGKIYKL